MERKKRIGFIIVIAAVLLAAVAGVLRYCYLQERSRIDKMMYIIPDEARKEQKAMKEAEGEAESQKVIEREALRKSDSFYQKLAGGFAVNILIVGDSIGAGYGSSDRTHNWVQMLSDSIQDHYNVLTELENISMGGNTSYAGYVRTMALDEKTITIW